MPLFPKYRLSGADLETIQSIQRPTEYFENQCKNLEEHECKKKSGACGWYKEKCQRFIEIRKLGRNRGGENT